MHLFSRVPCHANFIKPVPKFYELVFWFTSSTSVTRTAAKSSLCNVTKEFQHQVDEFLKTFPLSASRVPQKRVLAGNEKTECFCWSPYTQGYVTFLATNFIRFFVFFCFTFSHYWIAGQILSYIRFDMEPCKVLLLVLRQSQVNETKYDVILSDLTFPVIRLQAMTCLELSCSLLQVSLNLPRPQPIFSTVHLLLYTPLLQQLPHWVRIQKEFCLLEI